MKKGEDGFVAVARVSEIDQATAQGCGLVVTVGARTLALFRHQGAIHAIDDMCPHRGGSLGKGTFENGFVTCPMHDWKFDVTTGQMPMGGGVASYPVRIDGDDILVQIESV